jgi:2-succinyl-6-hydroxy-2,4-cyclohexadiene-1-carboxylate synthase
VISAIHGFTGGPDFWRTLKGVGEMQRLTVLGHGPLSFARGDETFADEVDRLASLLPPHCEHLLGYSLGARLSLAIAAKHPHRIGKLTLIGVHPGLASEVERETRIQSDRRWIDMLQTQGIEDFVHAWQALPMWQSQQDLPDEPQAQQRRQRLSHDATQLARALQSLGTGAMPPMWQELSRLTMPVSLLVGSRDHKYQEIAESMLSLLPQGRLTIIDEAGHNPVLEQPAVVGKLLANASPVEVAL